MAGPPLSPGPWTITSYTNVGVTGDASSSVGGSNGSTVVQWEVAWGTSPTVPASGGGRKNLNGVGYALITGLDPGTTYYFWNRQRNAFGWSNWSPRTHQRLRDIPSQTDMPVITSKTQNSVRVIVYANYTGDSPITQFRLRYSLSTTPTNVISQATNIFTLTNLNPGLTHYFWGQAVNKYGDSYYSLRAQTTLLAGASVKVGLVWKRAVPYVKVNGVWRVAQPWARIQGNWFESTSE